MTTLEHYPEFAKILGLPDLYFKREDLHKYGSHKGRSIPVMIDHYLKQGDRRFAISSSGNAALAAGLYVLELNREEKELVDLDIFVGKNVAEHKLKKLKDVADRSDGHIRVLVKERTLHALAEAVEEGARSLRQSTDDIALIGYESLSKELAKIKDIGSVFVGTSSGTTAQALAEYFLKKKNVQIHIIQTSSCHPIADSFENYDGPEEKSIADAIVSQTTERKDKLTELLKETGGYAWVATNTEIKTAKELTKKYTGLDISNNSALAIVGAMQAVYRNWPLKGSVVCLICGD